jgi:predicted AAA+ superfamily ATPase
MSSDYRLRIADPVLAEMVADFPVISIIGPRASGKTTTALRHAQGVIRLDAPGTAAVVQANPDAAIRDQPEPLLIDEWHEAPAVLGAVKRTVDADPRAR